MKKKSCLVDKICTLIGSEGLPLPQW